MLRMIQRSTAQHSAAQCSTAQIPLSDLCKPEQGPVALSAPEGRQQLQGRQQLMQHGKPSVVVPSKVGNLVASKV